MSILLFHWIRFFGAILTLLLAILYLTGFELISLAGFIFIGIYAAVVCILVQNGTLPARCDLCGSKGTLKAEYGHTFTNVRLVLSCPQCGRVVNTAKHGIRPGKEHNGHHNNT